MMKRSWLAAVISSVIGMSAAQAAEIYNKDGNKLDLVGKINVSHLFSDDSNNDGDTSSYAALVSKARQKSPIS